MTSSPKRPLQTPCTSGCKITCVPYFDQVANIWVHQIAFPLKQNAISYTSSAA